MEDEAIMTASKNILVTGGAGYIGSHTCKALYEGGYTPIVLDNLSSGRRDSVQWGPLEVGDVLDQDFLKTIFYQYDPQAVIHFAASIEVGESVSNPLKYYQNNVVGSLSLLRVMDTCNTPAIVFSGTCAIYGKPERVPVGEDCLIKPLNAYGKTKHVVEMMLEDYSKASSLRYVTLRYFNACGADPSGMIGENHDPETHLIPRALMAATGRIDTLELFGSDYSTPDGTCIRDYIHVCDLARAHVKSLEYLLEGKSSATFNLGTGKGYSVFEILDAVEKVTGLKVPRTMHARRPGDSPILVSNSDYIHKALGFSTQWNNIEDVIESAWNYYRNQWGANT